jgi:hypothetical protein
VSGRTNTSFAQARGIATATVLMLLLVRVVAIIHVGLVPHWLSSETGGFVHSTHGSLPHEQDEAPPLRESAGEECMAFAVLSQASNVAAPLEVAVVSMELPGRLPVVHESTPAASPWALYRLAPSRPPPAWRI